MNISVFEWTAQFSFLKFTFSIDGSFYFYFIYVFVFLFCSVSLSGEIKDSYKLVLKGGVGLLTISSCNMRLLCK